eukprot:15128492-Alexandrium_andersonii.AAC.1
MPSASAPSVVDATMTRICRRRSSSSRLWQSGRCCGTKDRNADRKPTWNWHTGVPAGAASKSAAASSAQ